MHIYIREGYSKALRQKVELQMQVLELHMQVQLELREQVTKLVKENTWLSQQLIAAGWPQDPP